MSEYYAGYYGRLKPTPRQEILQRNRFIINMRQRGYTDPQIASIYAAEQKNVGRKISLRGNPGPFVIDGKKVKKLKAKPATAKQKAVRKAFAERFEELKKKNEKRKVKKKVKWPLPKPIVLNIPTTREDREKLRKKIAHLQKKLVKEKLYLKSKRQTDKIKKRIREIGKDYLTLEELLIPLGVPSPITRVSPAPITIPQVAHTVKLRRPPTRPLPKVPIKKTPLPIVLYKAPMQLMPSVPSVPSVPTEAKLTPEEIEVKKAAIKKEFGKLFDGPNFPGRAERLDELQAQFSAIGSGFIGGYFGEEGGKYHPHRYDIATKRVVRMRPDVVHRRYANYAKAATNNKISKKDIDAMFKKEHDIKNIMKGLAGIKRRNYMKNYIFKNF